MKQQLHEELDRLERLDVIEKVDKPTDWVSRLVKKPNGTVRICLAPKSLNRAVKCSHYPVPTLDDVLPSLVKAKVFTITDVCNGFWHIELDAVLRELTTFGTPFGDAGGSACWAILVEVPAFSGFEKPKKCWSAKQFLLCHAPQ